MTKKPSAAGPTTTANRADRANTPANPDAQSASSEGMPDKSPRAQRSRTGQQDTPKDGAVESSLELPHERDQATDMTDEKKSAEVEQAGRDLKAGRQDTSKAPEMDKTYRKL